MDTVMSVLKATCCHGTMITQITCAVKQTLTVKNKVELNVNHVSTHTTVPKITTRMSMSVLKRTNHAKHNHQVAHANHALMVICVSMTMTLKSMSVKRATRFVQSKVGQHASHVSTLITVPKITTSMSMSVLKKTSHAQHTHHMEHANHALMDICVSMIMTQMSMSVKWATLSVQSKVGQHASHVLMGTIESTIRALTNTNAWRKMNLVLIIPQMEHAANAQMDKPKDITKVREFNNVT